MVVVSVFVGDRRGGRRKGCGGWVYGLCMLPDNTICVNGTVQTGIQTATREGTCRSKSKEVECQVSCDQLGIPIPVDTIDIEGGEGEDGGLPPPYTIGDKGGGNKRARGKKGRKGRNKGRGKRNKKGGLLHVNVVSVVETRYLVLLLSKRAAYSM